jgi:hypothetical protein
VLTKVERAMADSSSRQRISSRSEGPVRCYEIPCGVGVYIWTGLFSIAFELRIAFQRGNDTMLSCVSWEFSPI